MPRAATALLDTLKRAIHADELARWSDQDLLERFVGQQDQAAFAALVKRHGALVLGVCRRMLRDHELAEDAFQAVFIILAKKAAAIRKREALPSWLFGVAQRVARQALKRQEREQTRLRLAVEIRRQDDHRDLRWEETLAFLEEELGRLPRWYQAPLLACYLEGRTQDEAARELGWPLATLRRRLEKGREILKARLTREGIAWSAALFTMGLCAHSADAVIADLRQRTLDAALAYLHGGPIRQAVVVMVHGGLRGVTGSAWPTLAAAVLLCCGLAGAGAVWSSNQAPPPRDVDRTDVLQPPKANQQPISKSEPLPPGAVARIGSTRFYHGGTLKSLHYTPDGKNVISFGGGIVRVWDADTGLEITHFPTGKLQSVAVEHSALVDSGRTLLVYGQILEDTLRYFDVRSGKQVRGLGLGVRRNKIEARFRNALSPDGRFAAAHTNAAVQVFDAVTGHELFRTNKPGDDVAALIFSGDSKKLIQSDKDGNIETWDAETGKLLHRFEHHPPVSFMAASPDGRWLATLVHDNHNPPDLPEYRIHVWDLRDAKEKRQVTGVGWLPEARFTPDSRRLLAHGQMPEGWRSVGWELDTGEAVANLLPQLSWAKAFHPDGGRFLEGWNKFHQWDAATRKRLACEDAPHLAPRAVCFDASGARLIIDEDGALSTWDIDSGKRIGSWELSRYPNSGPSAVLSADGTRALVWLVTAATLDMRVLDVARETSVELDTRAVPKPASQRLQPVFTADGRFVAAWQPEPQQKPGPQQKPAPQRTGLIHCWDAKTGGQIRAIPAQKGGLNPLMFAVADGAALVVAGKQIVGVDATSGKELFAWEPPVRLSRLAADGRPIPDGSSGWSSFAFSPDGTTAAYILYQCYTETPIRDRIVLCDGRTGKLLRRLHDADKPASNTEPLAFSPDGRRLVSVDGQVAHLWDVATGVKLRTFRGHRGKIDALAFDARGDRLATVSADTTVLIWDLTH